MSALQEPPRKPQRSEWPRWTEDKAGDKQRKVTVPVGLAVTVLIHLLAIGLFPWNEIGIIEKERPQNPPLEVEFLPPPPQMPEFVEANPMAPEEKSDTDKISFQDQVAAQEVPDPTQDNDTPAVDGEELESEKIVSGDLTAQPGPSAPEMMSEPAPDMPATQQPEEQQQEMAEQQEPQEEQPTEQQEQPEEPAEKTVEAEEPQYLDQEIAETEPGMDKAEALEVEEEPTAEEGILAATETGEAEVQVEETVEETAQPEKADNSRVQVYMEEVMVTDAAQQAAPSSEPRPQARPRLNFVQTTSGPLKREQRASNRVGAIAVDAKFDKFGAYLQRMIEAIDLQWQILVRSQSTIMADLGSRVVVRYTINQQGEITNMEVLFSSASRSATAICVEAIQSRAPFGIWTQEMVRTLGESQNITITYYFR
ncbi:hypothetical protein [Cerasicoccus fimbriatus]|uniref:hypothetical protein n=1 Tax=Cerasicoccus fimbriatus TaxID=3014554 RepID=UPI0022B4A469|nr:hypothetical protein [Cerasicoccus sp. TK19100]